MNKIFVEDFYEWRPDVLMASSSIYDKIRQEYIVIRLYSYINYRTEEVDYAVYVSCEPVRFERFNWAQDAIDYYNQKLKEYEDLCS